MSWRLGPRSGSPRHISASQSLRTSAWRRSGIFQGHWTLMRSKQKCNVIAMFGVYPPFRYTHMIIHFGFLHARSWLVSSRDMMRPLKNPCWANPPRSLPICPIRPSGWSTSVWSFGTSSLRGSKRETKHGNQRSDQTWGPEATKHRKFIANLRCFEKHSAIGCYKNISPFIYNKRLKYSEG